MQSDENSQQFNLIFEMILMFNSCLCFTERWKDQMFLEPKSPKFKSCFTIAYRGIPAEPFNFPESQLLKVKHEDNTNSSRGCYWRLPGMKPGTE